MGDVNTCIVPGACCLTACLLSSPSCVIVYWILANALSCVANVLSAHSAMSFHSAIFVQACTHETVAFHAPISRCEVLHLGCFEVHIQHDW